MKNLESLKSNKFSMKNVKGGALYVGDVSHEVHMTASYTRPTWDPVNNPNHGNITNDIYTATSSGDPGYSNVLDQ